MLANQCEGRVQGLLAGLKGKQLEAVKADLLAIKEAFKLEDLDQEEDEGIFVNQDKAFIYKL